MSSQQVQNYDKYYNQALQNYKSGAATSMPQSYSTWVNNPQNNISMANQKIANTAAGSGLSNSGVYSPLDYNSTAGSEEQYNYAKVLKAFQKNNYGGGTSSPTNPNNQTTSTFNTAPPTYMSYDEALENAKQRVNPQFDILRGRMEQQQSKEQEELPQYLAARFGGISGLSGGMKESNQSELTQKQAQAIQDLEYQKEQVLNQTANDYMNDSNAQALAKWQAESDQAWKQQQLDYQANRDKILDARTEQQNNLSLWLQMQGWSREDARRAVEDTQWQQKYNLEANSLDYNPDYQAARIAEAWRSANQPYGRSGGGSGSSTSEDKSKAAMNTWVTKQVSEDPRLLPDMSNYNALYDAWKTMYATNMYGG